MNQLHRCTWLGRSLALPGCALVLALLVSPSAQAQDRRVIQNRTYAVNHELQAELGLLPLDVLYKAPTVSLRYQWHINDYVGWEVLSVTYAPTTDLSLLPLDFGPFQFNHFSSQGNELQDNFGYRPFDIDQIRFIAESNFVLTPLYGKFSLFNRSNARLELFGLGGAALANYIAWNPWPPDPLAALPGAPALPSQPSDFVPMGGQTLLLRPGLDIGGGTRLFLGQRVSVRLDARAYGFFEGYRCLDLSPVTSLPLLNQLSCPDASPDKRDSRNRLFPSSPREAPSLPFGVSPALYIGTGISVSLGGGS
ncbi:MAG: hypothetical protein HY904_12885 [Deltaproteobacteria bacterium]|nr:hypothetical protein [Deltaproteobacteria bacterium]